MKNEAPRLAVIGDPVAHSLSPLLHTALFSRLGVDADYTKIQVRPEALAAFMQRMRNGRDASRTDEGGRPLTGVNVTLPHKIAVLPLLDEVHGDALLAGAVNTVVRKGGRLVGYNTDMEGLLYAVRARGHDYAGNTICVFGTGGAALGLVVKAASSGAKELRLIGRNPEKGEWILTQARGAARQSGTAFSFFDIGRAAEACANAGLLINATPLGMSGFGADFDSFAFLDALQRGALVYDCVYTPAETGLFRAATVRGLDAETGLSMLVWQGLISDTLFLKAAGFGCAEKEILSKEVFEFVYNRLVKELCERK